MQLLHGIAILYTRVANIYLLPSFTHLSSFHNSQRQLSSPNLVSTVALLLLNGLLEPVLLHGRRAGLSLALNLGHLALVGLELAGNVGLLGEGERRGC